MKRTGIKIDAYGFIQTEQRAIAVGDTLEQNVMLLLALQQGESKEHPLLGIGISDIVNDENILDWQWRIVEGLAIDGIKVKELAINNNTINITGGYES